MAQMFLDESKSGGYLLAAAVVVDTELAGARQAVRELVLPGQRRLHMTKESDSRRRRIVDMVCATVPTAVVFDAGLVGGELDARRACLTAAVAEAGRSSVTRMVLEQDDSLLEWDRRTLFALTRGTGLRYDHLRAAQEELLAVADAVAWC